MKKRATYRRSKQGTAAHNDREFDLQKAEHIDVRRESLNKYVTFDAWGRSTQPIKEITETAFKAHERNVYAQLFMDALESTNAKYREQGHAERCKTIDDWLNGEKTKPSEEIYQIGDMKTQAGDPISRDVFESCVNEFVGYKRQWGRDHGDCLHVLDLAFHYDETSDHAHLREIFSYRDADGNRRIGQEKALTQAGIPLPEPTKPIGRFNNRIMTLTAQFREKWYQILESRGIQIEREPRPRRKHLKKEDFINKQLAEENERLRTENKKIKDENENMKSENQRLKIENQNLKTVVEEEKKMIQKVLDAGAENILNELSSLTHKIRERTR